MTELWGRLKAAHAPRPLLVTRNVRDFEPTGVTLLNPFDER
jgi:hypothetical protein